MVLYCLADLTCQPCLFDNVISVIPGVPVLMHLFEIYFAWLYFGKGKWANIEFSLHELLILRAIWINCLGQKALSVRIWSWTTVNFVFQISLPGSDYRKEGVNWWEIYPSSHSQNWQDLISVVLRTLEGSISVVFALVMDSSHSSLLTAFFCPNTGK